jgi:NDP-sugar pyrophosphorylase family protein
MEAVVLAAGLGERLRPLSLARPKCLFPVMNRPLLEVCLEWLAGLGVVRVRLNAHYLMEQVEAWLSRATLPLPVDLSRERQKILGTGGGIRQAARGLTSTFAVVNADCLLRGVDVAAMLAAHREGRALATLLLQEEGSVRNITVEGGLITSLRGRPEGAPGAAAGFTGLHLMEPGLISRIPEGVSDIIEVYLGCLERGERLCGHVSRGHYFCDMGTPASYLGLHRDVFAGRLSLPGLGAGAGVAAGVDDGLCLAQGVVRGEGCLLGPEVVAGPGVSFGAGCVVRRSILWEGASVAPGVEVSGCVVGQGERVVRQATDEVLVAG